MFTKDTRVLIVDDMSMMRKLIKAQLREIGFTQVFEAEDGARALVLMEEQAKLNTPVQLILSDWTMPILSGIELLTRVRAHAHFKKVPFIMITAEGESHQVTEAIKLGVSSFIRKPFSPDGLKSKIEAVWQNCQKAA